MTRIVLLAIAAMSGATPVFAGVTSQAVKVATRKIVGETAEVAAKKTAQRLAAEAAERAAKEAAKVAARRAATTAAQHFGKAVVSNVPRFADDLAVATARLSARNSRRLMMMAPKLAESGQAPTVVAKLAAGNGDDLIETLWKHREKIGAAAVVTGLVLHGDDVVKAGGEFVAKPVIDGTMNHVVAPASHLLVSGVVLTVLIGLVALAGYLFGGEATDRVMGTLHGLARLFGRQW